MTTEISEICDGLEHNEDISKSKLQDYGASFLIFSPVTILSQIETKLKRAKNLFTTNSKVDELITDSLYEAANYSLLAYINASWSFDKNKIGASIKETFDKELISDIKSRIEEVSSDAKQIILDKNHDYGQAWIDMDANVLVDFAYVKLARMYQLSQNLVNQLKENFDFDNENPETATQELLVKIRDNAVDIAAYCMFAAYVHRKS